MLGVGLIDEQDQPVHAVGSRRQINAVNRLTALIYYIDSIDRSILSMVECSAT